MKNSVPECGLDIILCQSVSDVEASVAGAGVALLVNTVAFGVFLFLRYILMGGDGEISIF